MSRRLIAALAVAMAIAPSPSMSSEVRGPRPQASSEPRASNSGLPTASPNQSALPVPTVRMTFTDAVDRAIQRNPSVRQAAAAILRAQGALNQTRSAEFPAVSGSVVALAQRHVVFSGQSVTPAGQVTGGLGMTAPLLAPALWAQATQAQDVVRVQEVGASDVRKQIAVATAQAYLAIIARRRVFEANTRARDVARAHYDLAHQQLAAGAGSLLNELRAQQVVSADDVLVEQTSLDVYRAQEALGVLVGESGPVDTTEEPTLQVPMTLQAAEAAMPDVRTDVRLATAQQAAALRVWKDSWKDWVPTLTALVQPQYLQPATFFSPAVSWRAQVNLNVPLFDAGFRRSVRAQRQALFTESQLQHESVLRQARSDVRTADESVKSADRALANARAAADQARRVLDIVNVSFKAGAATEIEVIDAQRALLDAETSVAVAEDALRQARLALLVAVGRFPA